MAPIEKLLTIIRLVHAGMDPDAHIAVTYHGAPGCGGHVVTHTLQYSAMAEADTLHELVPDVGGYDLTGKRNVAQIALEILEAMKTHAPR